MKKDYMKHIALIAFTYFLICFYGKAHACQIQVPTSEAQRIMEALPNGVPPLWSCSDKPGEKCHCADEIIWEHSELVDVEVFDHFKKVDEVSCEKAIKPEVAEGVEALPFNEYQDCDDKFEALVCNGNQEKIKNYGLLQVYCAKPVMKTEPKLQNSEAKKAQHKAAKEAEKLAEKDKEDKKKAAKDKVKTFKFKGTTIKELRDELNDYMKENAEVIE